MRAVQRPWVLLGPDADRGERPDGQADLCNLQRHREGEGEAMTWRVGDLAECVSRADVYPEGMQPGTRWIVSRTLFGVPDRRGQGYTGTGLAFLCAPQPNMELTMFDARRFRKVSREEATEEEREVMDALAGPQHFVLVGEDPNLTAGVG